MRNHRRYFGSMCRGFSAANGECFLQQGTEQCGDAGSSWSLERMRLPTVRRWVTKTFFFFKGTKKKIFKESLIIMVRLLRVAKPILLTLVMLCSFILAESLTGDVERPCALCQGIKTTCSQSRMAGERSSSHCIT